MRNHVTGSFIVVIASSLLALPLGLSGCLDGKSNPVTPHGGLSSPSTPTTTSYPNYSFGINIPWLCQVPPGDWAGTKNCGQTCAVMISGGLHGTAVNAQAIKDANNFLASRLNDARYRNANGWYTNFGGTNALGILLSEKFHLNYSVRTGTTVEALVNQLNATRQPMIVGVMIKNGQLVSSGGVAHWAVLIGWDGQLVLQDPGSSSGRSRHISVANFAATWATQGRIYALVS